MDEEDLQPTFTIKKRGQKKNSRQQLRSRPSSSAFDDEPAAPSEPGTPRLGPQQPPGTATSDLSSTPAASTSSSRPAAVRDGDEGEEDDQGSAVKFSSLSSRSKKTPAGRVRAREGDAGGSGAGAGRAKSRLSFGSTPSSPAPAPDDTRASDQAASPRPIARATLSADKLPTFSAVSGGSSTVDPSAAAGTGAGGMYSADALAALKRQNSSAALATASPSASASATASRGGYDDLTMSKFGSRALANDDENEGGAGGASQVPDQLRINEAKARRERMRAEGVSNKDAFASNDGFVRLDIGPVLKGGDSRLVREEDELGDGDDDMAEFTGANERVPLGKKANAEAARRLKAGMMELIDDAEMGGGGGGRGPGAGDDDDDDEETRRWEAEMMRRGEQHYGSHARPAPSATDAASSQVYRAAPIPRAAPLPTLSGASGRVQSALMALEEAHTLDSKALEHFAHERAELDQQEKELREEVGKVAKKERWFAELRSFIEDVAGFLDAKGPLLERIERDNLAIHKERYEIVARRRFEDDSDDVALFTGADVSTKWPPKLRSADDDDEETAAEEEEAAKEGAGDVDEMGRTRRDYDTTPRSALRVARRGERERRQASAQRPDDWTDDELVQDDTQDLFDAIKALRETLRDIFDDVTVDDFRDPNLGIRARFAEWRESFADEYWTAFGGLALVQVWEFWIRVELAMWNPFAVAHLPPPPPSLDTCRWHKDLLSYGQEGVDPSTGNDESEEIVNSAVVSTVVPKLEKLARESYDPLSRAQTSKALAAIDDVSYCVDRTSPRFTHLVAAFVYRFQLAISQTQHLVAPHLDAISLPRNSFDPSVFPARNRFLRRQLKLFSNAVRWRRFAKDVRMHDAGGVAGGSGTFDQLLIWQLVAKVMLPVLEAGWGTGGSEIATRLLEVAPPDFFPGPLTSRLRGEAK